MPRNNRPSGDWLEDAIGCILIVAAILMILL